MVISATDTKPPNLLIEDPIDQVNPNQNDLIII